MQFQLQPSPSPDSGTPTPDAGSPDAGPVAGLIQQLQIVSTYDAYDGGSFGTVGQYQVISGIVHGRLNPNHPANAGIVDLNLAPVDSDGMVEYTTDFVILRPKEVTNAKRILFYDVNNRGNQLAQGFINNGLPGFAAGAQGDALLLRLGYTLVWSGWQGDIAQSGQGDVKAIGATFPVAHNADGSSITGVTFEEAIFNGGTTPLGAGEVTPPSLPAAQTATLPENWKRSSNVDATGTVTFKLTYPASTMDQTAVTFNWRESYVTPQGQTFAAPSTPIPTSAWSYVDSTHVTFNLAGLGDMGAIYDFTYTAKDPVVNGIGFAAVRDFVSFLRNSTADAMGNPNPLNDFKTAPCQLSSGCSSAPTNNYDVAIMEGISQSGASRAITSGRASTTTATATKSSKESCPSSLGPGGRGPTTGFLSPVGSPSSTRTTSREVTVSHLLIQSPRTQSPVSLTASSELALQPAPAPSSSTSMADTRLGAGATCCW